MWYPKHEEVALTLHFLSTKLSFLCFYGHMTKLSGVLLQTGQGSSIFLGLGLNCFELHIVVGWCHKPIGLNGMKEGLYLDT